MRMYKNGKIIYYIMITSEEFRLLPGFEDKVKVSNLGYAINLNYKRTGKERRFKLSPSAYGYLKFGFAYKGKKYYFKIHQIVAKTFIPNPDNLPEVNHKDENKENNCVDNLEWCTHVYNCNYGTRNKRAAEKIIKRVACYKNGKLVKIYPSIISVEEDGFSRSCVSKVCAGKQDTHPRGVYTWRFID